MPVVFIHGITVRKDRFPALLSAVKDGFSNARLDLPVEGFYWGDMATPTGFAGLSIPGFGAGRRALGEVTEADARQLAMLLLDDPLLELRILKDAQEFNAAGAGFTPLPPGIEQRNQQLAAAQPKVAAALATSQALARALQSGSAIPKANWSAMVQPVFEAAGKCDRALSLPELIDPLTRALTASLYREVEGPVTNLDSEFQWGVAEEAIAKILEQELGGQRGWLGDKLKKLSGGAAAEGLTLAMRHGLRKRVMESMSLFVGDVLAYMAKREAIQAALQNAVDKALATHPGPLWLVGHSMGGILAFDYCLRTGRNVERLVTVGSQVGLFAEVGAFPTLQSNPAGLLETPASIKQWINIYDPDDILSFLAASVLTRSSDVEFDTQVPFPPSHSEYWNRARLYEQAMK